METKPIEFTKDELNILKELVYYQLRYLGRVQDPRIEEYIGLDDKISAALGEENEGWTVFLEALHESEVRRDRDEQGIKNKTQFNRR